MDLSALEGLAGIWLQLERVRIVHADADTHLTLCELVPVLLPVQSSPTYTGSYVYVNNAVFLGLIDQFAVYVCSHGHLL